MPRGAKPPVELRVSREGFDDTLVTIEGTSTHLGALRKVCAALKLPVVDQWELVDEKGEVLPADDKRWDPGMTNIHVQMKWVYQAAAKLEAQGVTPEGAAAMTFDPANDDETVELLVDAKLAPKTAVIDLAELGYWCAAMRFVRAGADVNAANRHGRTAVMIAVQKGYHALVRELGKAGADVTLVPDVAPWVAIIAATTDGDVKMVKELIDARADVDQRNICGFSALMEAAWNGRIAIVETLLEAGADVNAAANNGWTALIGTASVKFPTDKDEAMLRLLLERGANPNTNAGANIDENSPEAAMLKRMSFGGSSDGTALHRACGGNWGVAVDLLLAHGADMEAADSKGMTPLHLATRGNHADIVQKLLNKGANAEHKDANGMTPLAAAKAMKKKPRQAMAVLEGAADSDAEGDGPVGKKHAKHADPGSPGALEQASAAVDLGPITVGDQVTLTGVGAAYEGRLAAVLEKVVKKKKVVGWDVMVLKDGMRKQVQPNNMQKVESYASIAVTLRADGVLKIVDAGVARKKNQDAEEKSVAKNFAFENVDGRYIRSQHARYNDLYCYYDVSNRNGQTNPVLGAPVCGTVVLLREQPPKFAGEADPDPFVKQISIPEVRDFLTYKQEGRAACINGRAGVESDEE